MFSARAAVKVKFFAQRIWVSGSKRTIPVGIKVEVVLPFAQRVIVLLHDPLQLLDVDLQLTGKHSVVERRETRQGAP
jgi:hypothetical protein